MMSAQDKNMIQACFPDGSGEEEVTYNYVYDVDGGMVMESTGTVTTIYPSHTFRASIGGIYEYVISGAEVITRSYFGVYTEPGRSAGSQRVAIREGDTLFYLLGDHLGSTSLTLDAGGNKISELRYKPWGKIRFSSGQ